MARHLELRINQRYEGIDGVSYIPRSHFQKMGGATSVATVEVIRSEGDCTRFTHVVMSTKELKKALGIKGKDITIL